MDFSLFYFADDSQAAVSDRYHMLLAGARFADEHGFTAVWTPERHFHPFGGLYPNPAVTGAAVAAVTSRVQIRAGSVVAPLHDPLRIAEEWSVVDNLSNGRAGVSFASGWHAADFVLRPENFTDRRRVGLEHADKVRRLWRGESIEVVDGGGVARKVRIFPPPVQAELPVWMTSSGSVESCRTAGRMGAGLLTHLLGQDVDDLAGKISEYRRAVTSGSGHVVLMVHTFLADDEDRARELVRGPLSEYLRSSLDLVFNTSDAGGRRIDPATLAAEDIDFFVEQSFERYFERGGLLGTVEKGRLMVERLREIGVDEVACLIDFGLPAEAVLAGLGQLNRLREITARS